MNQEEQQIHRFLKSEGGKFGSDVVYPPGWHLSTTNYKNIAHQKAVLFENAPRVNLSKKRPTLRLQKNLPGPQFSKIVVFEPLKTLEKMIERIEVEIHEFEETVNFDYSDIDQVPLWGFNVKDYGFYDWYLQE